ncbi:hypothetical protein GCM10018954_030250 [Kutzneria kofuensis]
MKLLVVSSRVCRFGPVPWNAVSSSSTTVRSDCVGTELARLSRLVSSPCTGGGVWVRACGMVRAGRQVRAAVGAGPQVDVLLADRRPVRDDRLRVGRDLRVAGVDVQLDADAVLGQAERADRPTVTPR